MKLNGWRRLAVVLGVVWLIGVVSLEAYEVLLYKDGLLAGLTLPVGTVISGNKARLPDGRTIDLITNLNGKDVKPWEIKWDNEPEIPTQSVVHSGTLFLGVSLPIILWFFIEGLVSISAWVGRGFREQKEQPRVRAADRL
jgi:hypothetical protein